MNQPVILMALQPCPDLDQYRARLRERGYEVVHRSSPGEALNFLESSVPSLLIVGQDAPDFEGRLVLERSLRLHPDLRVVVVAQVEVPNDRAAALTLGAVEYLERPDPADLARRVESQLLRTVPV